MEDPAARAPRPSRRTGGGAPPGARRAVVVGAGISGLATAGLLARMGWETAVLEQSPGPRRAGYMIDFFGPGFDAAERQGLLGALHERAVMYDGVAYVDGGGRTTARLGMDSFLAAAGGRFFSILRPDIEAALREWLPASVEIHQDARVVDVEPGRLPGAGTGPDASEPAVAVLGDGRRFPAELLVGADGIHSAVRRALYGAEERYLRHLDAHVSGFVFEDPAMARRLGGDVHLTDSLRRQAGLYAMPDGRVAFFGVHATDDRQLPRDPRSAVVLHYRDLGWELPAAVGQVGQDVYYDVVAQSVVPQWRRGRTVLMGDAAHAVSLLAGQGASLAVAGAEVLAANLAAEPDLRLALHEYERDWRPVADEQQRAGRRNAGLFLAKTGAGRLARRLAVRAMGLPGVGPAAARSVFGAALPSKGRGTPG